MLDALSATTSGTTGLGWGVIGFGWVAQDYAVPGLLDAGGRLVAIADPDARARRRAAALGARAEKELRALLEDPAVQAVYVATPNHLHRAAVEAAVAAGKPVLCEKPMATTLAEAEAMAMAVRRAGIPYGTAFDQRHHPAHQAMRDAIAAGAIGKVTAIRIAYACWVDPGWAGDNWRADPARAGGGALMDLAPHGIDLVQFLLGEPLLEIAALTQCRVQDYAVDDGALLIGRTVSGILVQLHVAYNCPEALPRRRLEVLGTTGQLLAERTMGQTAGGRVWRIDGRLGLRVPLPVPEAGASPSRGRWRPLKPGCAAAGTPPPSRSTATSTPCVCWSAPMRRRTGGQPRRGRRMPLKPYSCANCGHWQRYFAPPPDCPVCTDTRNDLPEDGWRFLTVEEVRPMLRGHWRQLGRDMVAFLDHAAARAERHRLAAAAPRRQYRLRSGTLLHR
ncbi:Gfo/Idh/MocA family protein [Dankookia sp. P2]|uniref:Gfo/Idh/MocA family protein n=1 Tax=Dankookia sp. P2 TaxID=3423955 RepID=UPI003D66B628